MYVMSTIKNTRTASNKNYEEKCVFGKLVKADNGWPSVGKMFHGHGATAEEALSPVTANQIYFNNGPFNRDQEDDKRHGRLL